MMRFVFIVVIFLSFEIFAQVGVVPAQPQPAQNQNSNVTLVPAVTDPSQKPDYYEISFNPPANNKRLGEWRVTQAEWSPQDEFDFSQFIVALYQSGCKSVDACIKNSANKYLVPDELNVFYFADCGRFPYFLRMYFAWKRGLPFSLVTYKVATQEDIDAWIQKQMSLGVETPDVRKLPLGYTPNGNIMRRRFDVPSADLKVKRYDFYQIAKYLFWRVDSGNYRFDSERPLDSVGGDLLPDYFPTKIQSGSVRPGTVFYDPSGHVLMVAEISPLGDVYFFDAHPDNSVSRPMFGDKHERGRPAMGPGFKNFRSIKLENPVYATLKTGETVITNGQMVVQNNSEISDYSIEQMVGTVPSPDGIWHKGKFFFQNMEVEFREWVKLNLARDLKKIDPVLQLKTDLEAFCTDMKTRKDDVDAAKGLTSQEHPQTLPANIHSGSELIPDWEPFSTPGRDRRARMAVSSLMQTARNYAARVKAKSMLMDYQGTDLWADMYKAAIEVNASCQLSYQNSKDQVIRLSLFESMRRLSKMSFDPYHCVERRWGASNPRELSSCIEDQVKVDWYQAEQVFRNKLDANPIFDLAFDLTQLQEKNALRGNDFSFDFERFLKLNQKQPQAQPLPQPKLPKPAIK